MPTASLTLDGVPVPVSYDDRGAGAPVLLLHGGGGPLTVDAFGARYADDHAAWVLRPVHPGFEGTPRPEQLTSIRQLAALYGQLLDALDLQDVTVVGNSIGGWIAAEMALLSSSRISRVVLVDAVGLQLDDAPIVDFFSLTLDQVADLSYANPDAFRIDPTALPEARRTAMAGNRVALEVYGGHTMADPTLLGRLPEATVPTLVVWGAADRIVLPEHGRTYAERMPQARFELLDDAGHLPQLETPERLSELVASFARTSTV